MKDMEEHRTMVEVEEELRTTDEVEVDRKWV
jgi:hypothetical protein